MEHDLITETTDATFEVDVLRSALPVLLDFRAPWSESCKAVRLRLERIAREYRGQLKVVKYNVNWTADNLKRFKVGGTPDVRLFRNGREILKKTEILSASGLQALLAAAFGAAPSVVGMRVTMAAFGGDAARKADCVARLREAIEAGWLWKAYGADAPVDGSALPGWHVVRAAEFSGAARRSNSPLRYDEVVGGPAALEGLHNYYYEQFSTVGGEDTRFALAWLEAIPVGVDLSGVPGAYAQWLLDDPFWGLAAYTPCDHEAYALWSAVLGAHRRLASGKAVVAGDWDDLSTRVVAWRDRQFDKFDAIGDALEQLCELHTLTGALLLTALTDVWADLAHAALDAGWWTEAERAMHRAMPERVAALREAHGQLSRAALNAQAQCLLRLLRAAPGRYETAWTN
jgi:thioredoxin 1